ncbi:hypothetical protein [Thermodesulforhabdus norvegica]|uniref:Uncharacterized protein n=1 Tax=Thermodesulforhabdus norvegica TaxID=39841 RepID=A0A1I4W6M5_9BACT|nr:hypothetical protein [Thermodesulforhabdus norvegica]SFN09344.1 hypothetical protein SAMN05660836_02641 [Thermodesulforhabdus norvegica]
MEVKANTIVAFRYRFFDRKGRPLHRGRWFYGKGMIEGDDIPEFLSEHLIGKRRGDTITIPVEDRIFEGGELKEELVPRDFLPDRPVSPGDTVSVIDDKGSSWLMKIIDVLPDHVIAVPLAGNPQKAAFIEVTVEEVRWATPEEFINRRASRMEKYHG